MNDRELLELAAKAAGIKGRYADGVIWYRNPFGDEVGFNPCKDDGDSRRLQVALRISLSIREYGSPARFPELCASAKAIRACNDGSGQVWEHDATEYALTPNDIDRAARYAVMHVAAAIGKAMP